jgi:uncharacterized membrane protein (DUF2068 family)
MNTALIVVPGSLVVSLGGMAYAVGGRVLRRAVIGNAALLMQWLKRRSSTLGAGPAAVTSRPALRAIALFEAVKGAIALTAGLGLLGLLHHDLHAIGASLIDHLGLDADARYPALVLQRIDQWQSADAWPLLLLIAGYVTVRFAEAYGLWHERRWGEWLGALSGALYVPFELRSFLHRPALATAFVIAVNVAVVGYLGWRLRRQSTSSR